ncbi:polysaccharide deacetylase family protein, partial [Patescibacteria group bacterium]|nr:polysaccharide deacetylase family protein [Patescibacteria group bacterium]
MKKFLITDGNLHIVFIAAIIILAATTLYFRFFSQTVDQYEEIFRSRISKFDLEHSLQEKAEEIKPGSVKVPILIYHSVRPHSANQSPFQKYYDVAPAMFEQQLQYLKDHQYVVIGLDYLADALTQGIILPQKSVVITFDDGWRNQYAYAFPLLRKYNDTAT